MPTAGEFCNRAVVTAKKSDTLIEAARRMRDEHVGSLVVVEDVDGRCLPIGVLTDRDIVVGVVALNAEELPRLLVGDVIMGELIKAWEEDDLADTLKRMRSYGVRRVPVVSRDGELVGLIAFDDIVEHLSDEINDLAILLSRERSRETRARP